MRRRQFLAPLLLLSLAACRAPAAPSSVVPPSWLGTPDLSGDESTNLSPEAANRLGGALDQLLGVHHEVLEGLVTESALLPGQPGECQEKWHLGGYMSTFGVTIGGIFGSISGSGTAAAEAHWLPAGEKPRALHPGSISIRESATPKELEQQLEPAIQGALASGLIQNERNLRANVMDAAKNFQTVARTLGGFELRGKRWQADVFRLEMQFDGNGSPTEILTFGSGVLIRFDWEKSKGALIEEPSRAEAGATSVANRLSERVQAFISAVGADMDVLDSDASAIESKGLKLTEVRVGAGFTIQGDVYFAEASGTVTGSFEFHPQDSRELAVSLDPAPPESHDDDSLLLMTNASSARTFASAGVPVDFEGLTDGGANHALVRIKRNEFRKGLFRANRIGGFFASRALSERVGRWGISELATEFDMSLGGNLGVATVGGTGVVELTYGKQSY